MELRVLISCDIHHLYIALYSHIELLGVNMHGSAQNHQNQQNHHLEHLGSQAQDPRSNAMEYEALVLNIAQYR